MDSNEIVGQSATGSGIDRREFLHGAVAGAAVLALGNRGEPFVHVVDGNYLNRGELYLAHQWTGLEIDAAKSAEVLTNLRIIWGRPVHLQARIKDEVWLLSMETAGEEMKRERIVDETARPAHWIE